MDTATPQQLFAMLFRPEGIVELATDTNGTSEACTITNTEDGIAELVNWVSNMRLDGHESMICLTASGNADVQGIVFESILAADQIKKFMVAQQWYALFAERKGLDARSALTLLQAYRELFPV